MGFATIAKRTALAAGIAGGAFMAVDVMRYRRNAGVSEGGTPHGTVTGAFLGYRHILGFAARHALQPQALRAAYEGERHARFTERDTFWHGKRIGYDDVADAFRHTYGSALITFRLMQDVGMSPERASAFTLEVGEAHENDSRLAGAHYEYARQMDEHNNVVGVRIATELHARGASEADVQGAVYDAIRRGESVAMDDSTSAPRATNAAELDAALARGASSSGGD